MRLKSDTRLRKKLFTAEAMSHPAKGHLGLWEAIIERYTETGQWILDPMAGVGATLTAALMGRNVICNEMEEHFVEPMRASWEKMKQHPMLGYEMGQVVILRGDARHLPLSSADAVITSPPYEGSIQGEPGIDWSKVDGGKRDRTKEARIESIKASLSGYTRPVDAVVTSPPYANRLADTYVDDDPQRMSYEMGKAKIDSIVTSPPYEGSHVGTPEEQGLNPGRWADGQARLIGSNNYAPGQNIGNQKGDAYWESMRLVYQECHRVLKPGGIMALVLKGFTRDGQYIDLPQQTAEMVESLGFTKFDEWTRELWSLSFWRILQKRRDPEAFDNRLMFEYVLAFRKDGEQGNGISAVITSPPYEGSIQGEPGIDWSKVQGRDMTKEPGNANRILIHGGYTRKEAQ